MRICKRKSEYLWRILLDSGLAYVWVHCYDSYNLRVTVDNNSVCWVKTSICRVHRLYYVRMCKSCVCSQKQIRVKYGPETLQRWIILITRIMSSCCFRNVLWGAVKVNLWNARGMLLTHLIAVKATAKLISVNFCFNWFHRVITPVFLPLEKEVIHRCIVEVFTQVVVTELWLRI